MLKKKLFIFLLTMAFSICSGMSVFGQEQTRTNNKFADVSNNGGVIGWVIKVPFESATLTVSAPNGKVFRREFRGGSMPSFSLMTNRGEFYGDGQFTYELVLSPVIPSDVREELKASRRDGKVVDIEKDYERRGVIPKPMVDSGTFSVLNGVIVKGNETEVETERQDNPETRQNPARRTQKAPAANSDPDKTDIQLEDQVIPDDLIVQGSGCFGFDCVNNESFGFDTIRLKENNLRIGFDDTSTGAGFPANDWQLTANDSASGGANKFSIDDVTAGRTPFTITAGAPTNSFFVDSTGRIGLRTSTPALDVHVLTSNTPAFRLDQSSAGGFVAQTWDIGANEANFFVRDVTGGSRLPFRIRPGAPTSSIDIAADGDVGMGTASPEGPLEIERNGDQLLLLDDNGKLTTKSSVMVMSGGITFADGTTQTTAAMPSTTPTYLGSQFSTHYIGSNATLLPGSEALAAVDAVTNAIGVKSGGGTVVARFNVATNVNFADSTAAFVVYKVRFRDTDGTGTGARVQVTAYANNVDTGAQVSDSVLDSNTQAAGSGYTTVTVCRPANAPFYTFASNGTWLEARLTTNSSFLSQAYLAQIQVYKSATCP